MKYFQSDKLQSYIDWNNLMSMPRYSGGHDCQMKGLFKDAKVLAHWNDDDCQGMVGTCVKFKKGEFKDKYVIYNDYYGSCSGCDSWEGATDEEVKNMCIGLSNSAYIFESLDDVKEFLSNTNDNNKDWSSWTYVRTNLLYAINKGIIKD